MRLARTVRFTRWILAACALTGGAFADRAAAEEQARRSTQRRAAQRRPPSQSGRPAGNGSSQPAGQPRPSGGGSQGAGRPSTPPPQAPSRPPVQAPSRPPVQAPSRPPVQAPSRPPVQAPSRPPVQAPSRPPAQAPSVERPVQPATPPARDVGRVRPGAPTVTPAVPPVRRPDPTPPTTSAPHPGRSTPAGRPVERSRDRERDRDFGREPDRDRAPSTTEPNVERHADRTLERPRAPSLPRESDLRRDEREPGRRDDLSSPADETRRRSALHAMKERRDGRAGAIGEPDALEERDRGVRRLRERAAARDDAALVTFPENSPEFRHQLRRLPRDTVPPNRGTARVETPAVDVDFDVAVEIESHRRGFDDVDVHFWWNLPGRRYPCWTDPCGIQYGYVFCGSSLWWYWWTPGCTPCFRPYRYYWAPSCWWLPSYYPSYATVYVVHETVEVPPADAWDSGVPAAAAGGDPGLLLGDGWTAFAGGRYAESIESFRQAVLALPDDPFAKLALAQAFFAIGNYADAAFLLRRAGDLLPDWPVVGEDPRGRYGDPADHYEQMVALRAFLDRMPGEPAATLVLAVQSYFTGDLALAREAFGALATLDPGDPLARTFLDRLGPAPLPALSPPDDAPPSDSR